MTTDKKTSVFHDCLECLYSKRLAVDPDTGDSAQLQEAYPTPWVWIVQVCCSYMISSVILAVAWPSPNPPQTSHERGWYQNTSILKHLALAVCCCSLGCVVVHYLWTRGVQGRSRRLPWPPSVSTGRLHDASHPMLHATRTTAMPVCGIQHLGGMYVIHNAVLLPKFTDQVCWLLSSVASFSKSPRPPQLASV